MFCEMQGKLIWAVEQNLLEFPMYSSGRRSSLSELREGIRNFKARDSAETAARSPPWPTSQQQPGSTTSHQVRNAEVKQQKTAQDQSRLAALEKPRRVRTKLQKAFYD